MARGKLSTSLFNLAATLGRKKVLLLLLYHRKSEAEIKNCTYAVKEKCCHLNLKHKPSKLKPTAGISKGYCGSKKKKKNQPNWFNAIKPKSLLI